MRLVAFTFSISLPGVPESWESRSLGSLGSPGVLGVSGVPESQTVNCTFARRGLFNFRDHDSSKYGKESEIDCQCPRQWTGLVTPRILQEVETFIAKFPMAEVLTCPEDKLSKCPTEILEEIFQYNRLEVLFWSTRRCVMLERDQSSGTSPW